MIIELPRKFYRKGEKNNGFAFVVDGRLEIHGWCDFEDTMVELTYALKGKNRCVYCRREIDKGSIDHLFPRNYGGISITNNLEPACRSCNSSKSDMNQFEFNIWRTISSEAEKRKFYNKIIQKKVHRLKDPNNKYGFDLPRDWIEMRELKKIKKPNISRFQQKGRHYHWEEKMVKRYHKLPRPIVLSANGLILDGRMAYLIAVENKLKTVPVIILENVYFYPWKKEKKPK